MKNLTFTKCTDVPAPFWLFCLEETYFRNEGENVKDVSKLKEIEKKLKRNGKTLNNFIKTRWVKLKILLKVLVLLHMS